MINQLNLEDPNDPWADADDVGLPNPVSTRSFSFRDIEYQLQLEFGDMSSAGPALFNECYVLEGRSATTSSTEPSWRWAPSVSTTDSPGLPSHRWRAPCPMRRDWKPYIIALTEGEAARAGKIDASFFPPLAEATLRSWESLHRHVIPGSLRGFLLQSDGLEAARGLLWPVLPLAKWELIDDPCASAHPWIRFGLSQSHHYHLSLGHSPSIYRSGILGSEEEFFAPAFGPYLEKTFRGEA